MILCQRPRALTVRKTSPPNTSGQARVGLHGVHEGLGDEHGQIEIAQARRVRLRLDESLDVGMIAAQGRPSWRRASRPRDMIVLHMASQTSMKLTGPDASAPTPRTWAPLGLQRREIVADAASPLEGECGFPHVSEDRAHVVADPAHDKAIEQRHVAPRAGAGENAPGGDEREIRHGVEKTLLPERRAIARVPPKPRRAQRSPRSPLWIGPCFRPARKPVFRVPDLLGDRDQSRRPVHNSHVRIPISDIKCSLFVRAVKGRAVDNFSLCR